MLLKKIIYETCWVFTDHSGNFLGVGVSFGYEVVIREWNGC